MFLRYGCRGIRFLSSTVSVSNKTTWDPVTSLQLNHQSLVLLEKCSSRNQFKQILAQIMRANLIGNTFPMSRLILFSAITCPENLDLAKLLFHHFTPNPNLFIFNTMISAVSWSNFESFAVYSSMLRSGIYPDKQTFMYIVKSSKNLSEIMQIHCQALVSGWLLFCNYLQNSLIKLYMENGNLSLAQKVFVEMPEPDVTTYNIMIVGYAKKSFCMEAIKVYHQMADHHLEPDDYTVLGLLSCCGLLENAQSGKSVHAWMEKRKSVSSCNLILGNALLDMYVKCKEMTTARKVFDVLSEKDIVSWNTIVAGFAKLGEIEAARAVFEHMPKRDLVSWNSMLSGFVYRGDHVSAIKFFNEMLLENINPDAVTMLNLVSAAAESGELDSGKRIHGWIVRRKMIVDAVLGSALTDMYCKCGSIDRASMVFSTVKHKDVTFWTTMISGLAFHGYGQKALELFRKMQKEVMPNKITLISVLTACSHSGLVEQGLNIFNNMKERYGIEPEIEHYGCLVDVLCRSGRLKEARDFVQKMGIKPSKSIWGSILSACRAKGDVEMAETALKELMKLEPDKEGGFVLLSNVYSATGKWSFSDRIREEMEKRGVKKVAGCSSVVVDGAVHSFVAADKQHCSWQAIEAVLNHLHDEIKLEI